MKSILETIKESQINECGGLTFVGGGSCGMYVPVRNTSVSKDYKSPREKDEEKKALRKDHPEVVKQYEKLYKEYFAAMAKAREVEAEMQALAKEYPALNYMTFKKGKKVRIEGKSYFMG